MNTSFYIRNFNFENPDFENVPDGFPRISKEELSREEGHLLDAIKTAWIISGGGRTYYYKRLIKKGIVAIAIVFVLFAGRVVMTADYTKEAKAETVSQKVEGVVQATMSAVFRK